MTFLRSVVDVIVKFILRILCRIHDAELKKIPSAGPFIIIFNHINFLELPLLFLYLQPRKVVGLVATKAWKYFFIRMLARVWKPIPLNQGEADIGAFHKVFEALEEKTILLIAPEGTRSGTGRLQPGQPGLVVIALHSRVPIYPVVHYGSEKFWDNLISLKQTDFFIRVGKPFYLISNDAKVDRAVRKKMIDEVMSRMASLLPADYRGVYPDPDNATQQYLRFTDAGP